MMSVTEFLSKSRLQAVHIRLRTILFYLFSINSLGSCFVAGFEGKDWTQLTPWNRILICVAIIVNWTGMVMAYLSQADQRLETKIEQTRNQQPTGTQ